MGLTLADQVQKIRLATGCPTTSEPGEGLSDTDIEGYVTLALNEVSRYLPDKFISSVDTVKNQQKYTLASGTVLVFNVYYDSGFSTDFDFLTTLGAIYNLELKVDLGVSWYHNPSLFNVFSQKLKLIRRVSGQDWEFFPAARELWIMPAPSDTGKKVYFSAGKLWTISTIPEHYELFIRLDAESRVLDALADRRSRRAGLGTPGFPQLYQIVQHLRDQAKDKRKEFTTKVLEQSSLEGGL